MNKKSNLIPLCKICHNKTTNGNLVINGYKETSNGLLLDYSFQQKKNLKKKKFNEQQIIKMKEYSKKDLPIKTILILLEKNENIVICSQTYKKILREEY